VARYVMTSLPFSTSSFTGHCRDLVTNSIRTEFDLPSSELAAATCPSETTVNQSRPKAPLRNEEPHCCYSNPSQTRANTSSCVGGARMAEDKDKECNSDPCPASLDKENVENIGLAREVARRNARILEVRLRDRIVRCCARLRREYREDSSEDQKSWKQQKPSSL